MKPLALCGLIAALMLASCAVAPPASHRQEMLSRRIADDAVAFNEAYGQAVSGQILLNILRARDRMPRYYLSMTGINDSPSQSMTQSGGIGSIPLGDGAAPWGFGGLNMERETSSRPTYSVEPFSAETLTRTAFQPIEPYVFAHYWQSGWPHDLLFFLLVERVTISDAQSSVSYVNEANNIQSDCTNADTSGCAFVRASRAFLQEIENQRPDRSASSGEPVCGLVESYGAGRALRAAQAPQGQSCDPRIIVGGKTYELSLRSLDDAVYYVGELMRPGGMISGDAPMEAPIVIRAAGLRGGGAGVPLFRILKHDEGASGYAASTLYAGQRYYAGPANGRSCREAAQDGACRDDAPNGDRSSSVLSLLAELLALNQSPDAIRAPNRLLTE